MMRLSRRQIDVLLGLVGTNNADTVSVYIEHLPRKNSFDSDREREKFLENLQRRGLISVRSKCFIRITDSGVAAIANYIQIAQSSTPEQVAGALAAADEYDAAKKGGV